MEGFDLMLRLSIICRPKPFIINYVLSKYEINVTLTSITCYYCSHFILSNDLADLKLERIINSANFINKLNYDKDRSLITFFQITLMNQ